MAPPAETDLKMAALLQFKRGFELLQKHKFDEALKCFAAAVKEEPRFPEAYKGIAECLRGKGDLSNAQPFLLKAAEAYVIAGKDEVAEDLYLGLRKAAPDTPNPFKRAADAYKEDGDLNRAIELFEQAYELSPRDEEVVCGLSEAYADAGRKDDAVQILDTHMARGGGKSEAVQKLFLSITGEDWYSTAGSDAGQLVVEDEVPEMVDYEEKRELPRLPLGDYVVRVAGVKKSMHVVNITMQGISFKLEGGEPGIGSTLTFDFADMSDVKVKKLTGTVIHVTSGVVGLRLGTLSASQEKKLSKVLVREAPPGFALQGEVNFDIPMY